MKHKHFPIIILAVLLSFSQVHGEENEVNFIEVSCNRLSDGGNTFYINGANCTYDGRLNRWDNSLIEEWFRLAAENGMNCVRIFACGESTSKNDTIKENGRVYQTGPGEWYEPAFKSTDYALYCARKYNVRIVFSLLTHTQSSQRYSTWAGLNDEGDFWNNETCKTYYKNYVRYLINRVNTYTGIAYKDDPYILAWEPGNEIDISTKKNGSAVDRTILDNWIWEMAGYIKSIDPNHLICSGTQGGYELRTNGEKWRKTHSDDRIDICSFHNYPLESQPNQTRDITEPVILRAISIAKSLGKPVFMGEYGISDKKSSSLGNCSTEEKEVWYRWFGEYATKFDLDGQMFWCWYRPDRPDIQDNGGGSGINPVASEHQELRNIIKNVSENLAAKSGAPIISNIIPKEFSNFKVTANGNNTKIQWETPTYNTGGSVSQQRAPLQFELRYDNTGESCTWGEMRYIKYFTIDDVSKTEITFNDIESDGVTPNHYYLRFRDNRENVWSSLSNRVICTSPQYTGIESTNIKELYQVNLHNSTLSINAGKKNIQCTIFSITGQPIMKFQTSGCSSYPISYQGILLVVLDTPEGRLTYKFTNP